MLSKERGEGGGRRGEECIIGERSEFMATAYLAAEACSMLHAVDLLQLVRDTLHPDFLLLHSADRPSLLVLSYAGKGGLGLDPELLILP